MSYVAVESTTTITANGIVLKDYTNSVSVKVGETFTISVTLENTDSVDHSIYVKVLDENGNELASTTDTLTAGSTKTYDLQVTAPSKVTSVTWKIQFGVQAS